MKKQIIYEEQSASIPDALKSTQEWFASIITNRMGTNNRIQIKTPKGKKIAEDAARYIAASPTLLPYQRIQIYNQQYWWRLLKTLNESFPLVTRLFGYYAFNETIAIPYLLKYPPHHWSLNTLGDRLPKWIASEYQALDKQLIQNATNLDWAFSDSFIAPQYPSLDLTNIANNPNQLLTYTFYLQPHIHLFQWDYNLFEFRSEFLKQEVDYWTDHDFPPLPKGKTYYFVLYRSSKNNLHWKDLSVAEYTFLQILQKGASIEYACESLEQKEEAIYEQAAQHLQKWLQEWVSRGWLTLEKYTSKYSE